MRSMEFQKPVNMAASKV